MEVSGDTQAPAALPRGREPLVSIEEEAGQNFWENRKYFEAAGI
jgi:hypothetical protein